MANKNIFGSTLDNFQKIFPSINLPKFDLKSHSFTDTLNVKYFSIQFITSSLIVPNENDLPVALNTMRHFIDEQ